MPSPSKRLPILNILILQAPIHRYSKHVWDLFRTRQETTPDDVFDTRALESEQASKSPERIVSNFVNGLPFPVLLLLYPTILVIRVLPTRFILTNGHSILLKSRNWFLPKTPSPPVLRQVLSVLIFPTSSCKNSVSTKQAHIIPRIILQTKP